MNRLILLFATALFVGLLGGFKQLPDLHDLDLPRLPTGPLGTPTVDRWDGPKPYRGEVLAALRNATVVPVRPTVPGYDRDCGPRDGCVFGPTWSDDTRAALAHDGCDTRNNVLAQQLDQVTFREGTHDCVVIAGVLEDPYTGQSITFTKERATEIGIDHIYPLARAWDMGAASWSLERRQEFANDPVHNLLAVSGPANSSKGDRGPGEWMPVNRGYACAYAARYLDAANTYDLPITEADADSLRVAAGTCPARKR